MGGVEEARYDHMPMPIEDVIEEIVSLLSFSPIPVCGRYKPG